MAATGTAAVAGADFTSGVAKEDLAPWISNISPDDMPFLNTIGTTKITSPRHSWTVRDYTDPDATLSVSPSFSFDTSEVVNVTADKLDNYSYVIGKPIHIEGSLMETDTVGAKNWFMESYRDVQVSIGRSFEARALNFKNSTVDGTVVYSAAGNRQMGGYMAYCANVVAPAATTVEINGASGTGVTVTGSTTANGGDGFNTYSQISAASGLNFGSHVVQYTAAPTAVALTADHLENLWENFHEQGGKPSCGMVPTRLKAGVSKLMINGNGGAAERRATAMENEVNTAVDFITVEFGFRIALKANELMGRFANDASSSLYFYDPSMIKVGVLKGMTMKNDGTARYGKAAIVYKECTIEYKNPNGQGAVIGITA